MSGGCSGLDPVLEARNLFVRPCAVARHRPVAESFENRVLVRGGVSVRPEVERPLHRLAVVLPKERLDVTLEADRLVAGRHASSFLRTSQSISTSLTGRLRAEPRSASHRGD